MVKNATTIKPKQVFTAAKIKKRIMPRLKTTIKPEMAVQMNLEAHERECAVRYQAVQDKLDSLDKRMWRLEGMQAVTTLSILGLVISIVLT